MQVSLKKEDDMLPKKKITRREFLGKTAKGALAVGFATVGVQQSCSKHEKSREIQAGESVVKKASLDLARISTCSICLNHMSAEEAFPIIAASGYRKVDVHEKVHLQIFPDLCNIDTLLATAEKNGLQIANLATYAGGGLDGRQTAYAFHNWKVPYPERFTSTGFSSDDPGELQEEMSQIRRTIDIAAFLGARSIRVVPGNDEPASLDKVVPWFKRAAEYGADKNVALAFENHSAGIAGTPELCVELAHKVGMLNFGILYEPGNLMFDTGTDYRQALETMKHHVVHCHFKDCKPVGDGKYEMQHFGEGTIDFPWIVEQLDAVGYAGDFALEYELHHPEPETGLKAFYTGFLEMFDE